MAELADALDSKAIAARLTNFCLSLICEQCRTKTTIQDTENVNRVSTDSKSTED